MKKQRIEYKLISLERSFFSPKADVIARALIGKVLVRRLKTQFLIGKIVEAEAYLSRNDKAAHSFKGKTKRTQVLYGEPGHAYIFQLRNWHCLNVVVEPMHSPGCVLIRAIEPIRGIVKMQKLRGINDNLDTIKIANGPGKVCQAFSIDMSLYGVDLTSLKSPLQICKNPDSRKLKIVATKRIGITKNANRKLRFTAHGSQYLSRL